jgi:diaminopimelate decarboxylase
MAPETFQRTGPFEADELADLAEHVRTPCYLYSEEAIRGDCAAITRLMPRSFEAFFALMANDNPEILRIVQEEGFGFFAGSHYHLARIHDLEAGYQKVVFAPSAVSPEAVELVRRVSGTTVFANSVRQFLYLAEQLPDTQIGLRVQTQRQDGSARSQATRHVNAAGLRIGLPREQVAQAWNLARREGVKPVGLHIYPGTDIETARPLQSAYQSILDIIDQLPGLSILDFGGGLPSTFQVPLDQSFWQDWQKVLEGVDRSVESGGDRPRVIFEIGRAVVARAGVFLTTVLDIVETDHGSIAICDGEACSFPRPIFYEKASEQHPVSVVGRQHDTVAGKYMIAGSTTYSGDLLHLGCMLPYLQPGDRLAFSNAGAYCASMSMRFLGATRPRELLSRNNALHDISV